MALTAAEKAYLDQLRADMIGRSDPKAKQLKKVIEEIDISNIRPRELRSICRPEYVVGINFKEIDTSPPFTTTTMNTIAPGAIDVKELASKVSFLSLLQGRIIEVLDTQSGVVQVTNELRLNTDIEDVMEAKTQSQGINLQMEYRSSFVNKQQTANKEFQSRFVR